MTETTTINYRLNVSGDHDFNFLVGQEGVNYASEGFQVWTAGQTNDLLTNVSSGTRASSWSDATASYAYLSFFGRARIQLPRALLRDFSVRADASSRFGKNNRWAGFWSLGLMWNARQERFLQNDL